VLDGRTTGHLVCVLRPAVFSGEEKVYSRAGHIPSSANLPYGDLVDDKTNALRSPEGLRASLAPLLEDGGRIILYCGGGITAAGTALALAVLGISNVAVYDGSLAEWTADQTLPLETGLS
jgi:thiosulfate/3-mercaptopyruvate sulfurtransferase